MTRGYLGELAFQMFMKKRWGVEAELGHERGELSDYLSMDIHRVKKQGEAVREPKIGIGIKTTKWNGIWMDIPGNQFEHSDIHVLIKIGAKRDHLFAFFKNLSVFKDKVLKRGEEVGSLSKEESAELFDTLPSFEPIPAYICGFVSKNKTYEQLAYEGKKGRLHYTITSWNGPIRPGDMDLVKKKEKIQGKVKFEGIGEFSHEGGYLFSTGNLLWGDKDWQKIYDAL